MKIKRNSITAIIGPSGCGKTTLLRCLNRMHELAPGTKVWGRVMFDGVDIYRDDVDPVEIRRRMGMVFQKANPFPMLSVYDNVAVGLRLNGVRNKEKLRTTVERSLKMAYIWDEVKENLEKPGVSLSGGQQQRLCI